MEKSRETRGEDRFGLSPWQIHWLGKPAEHLKRYYDLPIRFGDGFCNLSTKPHILLAGKSEKAMDDCLKMMLASLESLTRRGEVVLSIYDGAGTVFQHPAEPDRHRAVMRFPWEVIRELEWANDEMARRYDRLKQAQCRNIKEFNQKNRDARMPLVVMVLHSLGELMSFQSARTESLLFSLSSRARAAGIHLICSTNRIHSDTLSPRILINFSTRLVFRTDTREESELLGITPYPTPKRFAVYRGNPYGLFGSEVEEHDKLGDATRLSDNEAIFVTYRRILNFENHKRNMNYEKRCSIIHTNEC